MIKFTDVQTELSEMHEAVNENACFVFAKENAIPKLINCLVCVQEHGGINRGGSKVSDIREGAYKYHIMLSISTAW